MLKSYEQRAQEYLGRDLAGLTAYLQGCRVDMHEPDEQGVKASVVGSHLDNSFGNTGTNDELVVLLDRDGKPQERFNLATLIALARLADLGSLIPREYQLTPLQITMLLHYHAIVTPYGRGEPEHANSPAVRQQREAMVTMGLLYATDEFPSGYRTTEAGRRHVERLTQMSPGRASDSTPLDELFDERERQQNNMIFAAANIRAHAEAFREVTDRIVNILMTGGGGHDEVIDETEVMNTDTYVDHVLMTEAAGKIDEKRRRVSKLEQLLCQIVDAYFGKQPIRDAIAEARELVKDVPREVRS